MNSSKIIKFSILAILICSLSIQAILPNIINYNVSAATSDLSASDLVKDMHIGYNIGNALDCCDDSTDQDVTYFETLWGNPQTTKKLVDSLKSKGFNAIRIPVTYYPHLNSDGTVDSEWLDRVEEVVKYVLDNNMYCIINMHHDTGANGWLRAETSTLSAHTAKFASIWTQIANRFQNYNSKLLFEGYNEILNSANAWNYAGTSSYQAANALNQTFVDTVRSTGGNNADRYLIVNTYAASAETEVMSNFTMPTDTASDKLIASVHSYVGTDSIDALFTRINTCLVSKNIPVIVGEFGMPNNTTTSNTTARCAYATKYISTAGKYGITCFWWDDGGIFSSSSRVTNYALINRNTCKWYFEGIANALVTAAGQHDISSAIPDEDTTSAIIYSVDSLNLSDFKIWKTGYYNQYNGQYAGYAARICVNDYVQCSPSSTYTYSCSNTAYNIIVREMDEDFELLASTFLASGDSITTLPNTAFLAIILYKPYTNTLTYDSYSQLFSSGITITLSNTQAYTMDNINELACDISNYECGNYNAVNGSFESCESRLCLNDFVECSADTTYKITTTYTRFRVLIRQMDANNNLIASNNLLSGDSFTTASNTDHLAIIIYCPNNSNLTYDDYEMIFNNGFAITIQ